MCKCTTEEIFLTREVVDEGIFGWGQVPQIVDKILYSDIGVLIDVRDNYAYLRLVDTSDYQCMDSGMNIQINFCPFCGNSFEPCK